MLDIEKTAAEPQALSSRMIEITPTLLREYADRLELSARHALPGEVVLCNITNSIIVVYKPDFPNRESMLSFLDGKDKPRPSLEN